MGSVSFLFWFGGGGVFFFPLASPPAFGSEFSLLPPAAGGGEVVAVQARRPAFAIENLVADVILDEALQLLLGRRAPPSAREPVCEGGDA